MSFECLPSPKLNEVYHLEIEIDDKNIPLHANARKQRKSLVILISSSNLGFREFLKSSSSLLFKKKSSDFIAPNFKTYVKQLRSASRMPCKSFSSLLEQVTSSLNTSVFSLVKQEYYWYLPLLSLLWIK